MKKMTNSVTIDVMLSTGCRNGQYSHCRRSVIVTGVVGVVSTIVCIVIFQYHRFDLKLSSDMLSSITSKEQQQQEYYYYYPDFIDHLYVRTPDRRRVPIYDLLYHQQDPPTSATSGRGSSHMNNEDEKIGYRHRHPHCLFLPTRGWGNNVYIALTFVLQAQMAAEMLVSSSSSSSYGRTEYERWGTRHHKTASLSSSSSNSSNSPRAANRHQAGTGIDLRYFTLCNYSDGRKIPADTSKSMMMTINVTDMPDNEGPSKSQYHNEYCVNYTFPCILPDQEVLNSQSTSEVNDNLNTGSRSSSSSEPPLSFGWIFTNLFVNMHLCPSVSSSSSSKPTTYFNRSSCPEFATSNDKKLDVHWMWIAETVLDEYAKRIKQEQQQRGHQKKQKGKVRKQQDQPHGDDDDNDGAVLVFENMFELNSTFIKYIMERAGTSMTLEQLVSFASSTLSTSSSHLSPTDGICAVQIRFGDYWTRNTEKDQRLCPSLDRTVDGHRWMCFEEQVDELLNRACPDPSVPIYVATDWNEFTNYLCTNYGMIDTSTTAMTINNSTPKEEEPRGRRRRGRRQQQQPRDDDYHRAGTFVEQLNEPSDGREQHHKQRKLWWSSSTRKSQQHQPQRRQFLSKCPSLSSSLSPQSAPSAATTTTPTTGNSNSKHSNDIDMSSQDGRLVIYETIVDWIVLILSRACELRTRLKYGQKGTAYRQYRSSFVSSTCFPWVVVPTNDVANL